MGFLLFEGGQDRLVVGAVDILFRCWTTTSPMGDRLLEEALPADASLIGQLDVIEHNGRTEGREVVVDDGRDELSTGPGGDRVVIDLSQCGDLVRTGKAEGQCAHAVLGRESNGVVTAAR